MNKMTDMEMQIWQQGLHNRLSTFDKTLGSHNETIVHLAAITNNQGKQIDNLMAITNNQGKQIDNLLAIANNQGKQIDNLLAIANNQSDQISELLTISENQQKQIDLLHCMLKQGSPDPAVREQALKKIDEIIKEGGSRMQA